MKKLFLGLLFILSLQTPIVFAYQPPKEMLLKVQFDSAPNKLVQGQTFHFDKSITINPSHEANYIVATQSEIIKNFPVTLAMLVKATRINDQQTELEFNVVHYGFVHGGTLLLQPKIILLNGQQASLQTELFTLAVSANWEKMS